MRPVNWLAFEIGFGLLMLAIIIAGNPANAWYFAVPFGYCWGRHAGRRSPQESTHD